MNVLVSAFFFTTQLLLVLYSAPLLRIQDKCRISDSECLTARVQYVFQAFAEGIPETGFEQLDPMLIDYVNVDREDFKFFMKDVRVTGLKNAVVDFFNIEPKLMRLVLRVDMTASSQYITNGYLFSLPISGEGEFTVRIDNVLFDMEMPYEIVKDLYGREVMNLIGLVYSYDVKNRAEYNLTNLYYGDKKASDKMHELINTNWKLLSMEYGRYLFDTVIYSRLFAALNKAVLTQPMQDILVF